MIISPGCAKHAGFSFISACRRLLASWNRPLLTLRAVLVLVDAIDAAEAVRLRFREEVGLTSQVKVVVELQGDLLLNARGQGISRLPLKAQGECLYDERAIVRKGPASSPLHVRFYHRADATSQIGDYTQKTELSADQRLIVVRTEENLCSLDSLRGPLTREELELIDNQANTALLGRLLPERDVALGETWTHPDDLVRPLLAIESIQQNRLKSRLRAVEGELALIDLEGSVRGSTRGVSTDLEVEGKYNFHLKQGRITWFTMRLKEDRAVGHAEPGIEVEARIRIAIEPGVGSPELADDRLAAIPDSAWASIQPLECVSEPGGLRFFHERDWRTMVDRHDVLILRLVQRGDLIAQCNLTRLAQAQPARPMTQKRFEEEIRRVLGNRFGQTIEASESRTPKGLRQLRVAVTGVASEIPIRWIYYHLSDDTGRQASIVFTLDEKVLPRFAAADELLVSSFEFVNQP